MPDLRVHAPFAATGDQPTAIEQCGDGVARGMRNQVLVGGTATG